MIGGTDLRGRGYGFETHLQGGLFPRLEFFGRNVAGERMVAGGGGEILSHGQQGDARFAEVSEGPGKVVVGFAQTEHEPGFATGASLGGALQQGEGTTVGGLRTKSRLQAFNGFNVVIQNVGRGGQYGLKGIGVAAKIGNQDFDATAGEGAA